MVGFGLGPPRSLASTAQQAAGGLYAITTSPNQDRAPGTGRWEIFAQTSTPTDKNVRAGDVLLLWNLYLANGGFLETDGLGTEPGSAYSLRFRWKYALDAGYDLRLAIADTPPRTHHVIAGE
ncbi:hypothetical protein ACFY0R_19890 [Streptomyces sp. NPDC001633]|uniref:hypothetical protein n=1 Tax=Streptomyces sp. NPDC001633 TaxID=3364595 RepID=UPI0036B9B324